MPDTTNDRPKTVRLGHHYVGEGEPCFITFEAGPTHDGLDTAKQLVKAAADAGANAVKFQVLDADRLVADREMLFPYEVLIDRETGETQSVEESLYEILCRRMLTIDEWRQLKRYCDDLNITFFSTATHDDEIDMLVDLECDSIKVASGDVNHLPLIKRIAQTGMCVQLDTGNSTLGEVETAIDVVLGEGNNRIIVHQCPSGYPARLPSINLNIIPTLKRMFGLPAAYSDHTPGWEMDVAAVAMGADMVEKTITLDRTIRSPEHMFSLEPQDCAGFVRTIRDVEIAFGSSRRIMTPEEEKKRHMIRRSAFLADAVPAGTRLRDAPIEFRRPGDGIPPDRFDRYADFALAADLPAGHKLTFSDLVQDD